MNIVEASVAALDKQLEEKIAEMEANNESPETIKAVIEEYESKKRELGLASRAEQQEMSFEQRKAAEDAEAERLESMRFVNHGHVTKEDIDEANKDSWWGHQDEDILPMLQEIYGEDYDIENDHSFRESVKFTNKITGSSKIIKFPTDFVMDISAASADMIAQWVDEDQASITDEQRHAAAVAQEKLHNQGGLQGGLNIIDKNIEGWNDHDPGMNPFSGVYAGDGTVLHPDVETVFQRSGGITGNFSTFWASGESAIHTNNTVTGERMEMIVDDVNDTIDEVIRSKYDTIGGTELEIEDLDELYEEIYEAHVEKMTLHSMGDERREDGSLISKFDYLLPRDQFDKMMGPHKEHLINKVDEHKAIFDATIGDARIADEVRDQAYYEAVFDRDHLQGLTEGELIKYELVQKAEPLEKQLYQINGLIKNGVDANGNRLTDQAKSQLEQTKVGILKQLDAIDADIKANAAEHGSYWGVSEKELASRFYLNGQNQEVSYQQWKAQFEAEGYIEARDNADREIAAIAKRHPGMTMREAEKQWFDDLMLESQILRRYGSTEMVSVDINAMTRDARKKVIAYLEATDPNFNIEDYPERSSAIAEFFVNDEAAYVDIPLSFIIDKEGAIKLTEEQFQADLGMDYTAEDFEGWYDEFFNYIDDLDWGLSKEDIEKLSQYNHEIYRNKGKRKAAFDKAYLDFDPASIDPAAEVGSVFGDYEGVGENIVGFVGTAINPKWWTHTINRGGNAVAKQWFDFTDEEVDDAMEAFGDTDGDRLRLDRIQSAAADFNFEYAEEIEAGEIEFLSFTEEQLDAMERGLAENVSDGVGEFVPTLVELAAITVATRGAGSATGISSAFTRLVNAASKVRGGAFWSKALYHGGHLALEEMKMKLAGFKPGSGAAFYAGGALGKLVFRPGALAHFALKNTRLRGFTSIAKGADPLIGATVGTGVIGAGSGEIAGITELGWEALTGERDFATGMQELYGDYDETTQRLLTNALVFGIAGQVNLSGKKGERLALNRTHFLITEGQKQRYSKQKEKIQKDLIRKNSTTVQEAEKKIEEYEKEIDNLDKQLAEGKITEAEYNTKKGLLEQGIKEQKEARDKEVDEIFKFLLSNKFNFELSFVGKMTHPETGKRISKEKFYTDALMKEHGMSKAEAKAEFQRQKAMAKRARFIYQAMKKNKSKSGITTELDKFTAAEEAMVSIDAMLAQAKLELHLQPTKLNKETGEMEWNPEFEKNYRETIIDPIERMIKMMAERNGGVARDLNVRWLDTAEAKEILGTASGRFDPETNTLIFSKDKYAAMGDGRIGAHELVHYALRSYFNAHGVQKQLEFQGRIEDAFKKEFGVEFDSFFTTDGGKIIGTEGVRREYEGKGRDKSVVNEEFLSNLAEFMSNPKIYYTKVANSFWKEIGAEMRSFVEESSLGKSERFQSMMYRGGPKEMLKLLARLGNDHRRGFDVSGKIGLLSRIGELEDANWMHAEYVDMDLSQTTESLSLSKRQQEVGKTLENKQRRKAELLRMNTGEGFSYTNAQKAEMKNLFPEIKELREELADIDSRLDRHKQTQDAVNQYQKALEANEITYEQFAKPKIEAEVAKLDKSKLGENEYNTEVLRIEEKFKPVNPNEKRALDKILELQGGYINKLRGQYKPIEGSELTKERWDAQVDAEVAKMMETYKKEKNDSFAAYLEGNLWRRTGDILKREGIDLETQFKSQSIDKMREAGLDIASNETASSNLDQSPGGEAIKTGKTKLVKLSTDGKLRKGVLPFTDKAISDMQKKAEAIDLPLDLSMNYRNIPNFALPHVKAMANPKAKSKKAYVDSNGKNRKDYGDGVQKKANFIANYYQAVNASPRRNLAVNAKGEGAGTATNVPNTLMNRKRPGEAKAREVFYKDMIGPDGKPVTVKMSKTGEFTRGEKEKGTGAKTGTRLKERIEMTEQEFLAEAGIVDNRTEAQKDRAKEIASKETLTPEDVKFMLDHGNVNISKLKRRVLDKDGNETSVYYDRGLHKINDQLINEVGQAASVQAVDVVKMNSPEFKTLESAAKLISNIREGKSPLLESRSLSKNLSEVLNISEAQAREYWEAYAYRNGEGVPKAALDYLKKTFDKSDFREALITLNRDAVQAHVERQGAANAKQWVDKALKDGSISPEILKQAGIAIKPFMGNVTIEGKKYKWIDYEAISEHFEFAELYSSKLPPGLTATLLKNLQGDLLGGRRGTSEFAKTLTEQFKPELIEGLYKTYRKQGLTEAEAMKKAEERVEKTNANGKKIYTEATSIINNWSEGKNVKPEFKEFLDKPENQKTGIVRRNKDGSHTEVIWTDPILTKLNEAIENAGSNMHEVFEGVDFSQMKTASALGTKYNESRKLREEGKIEEANDVIREAFTKLDSKAKKALYYGTGVVLESLIRDAKTPEAKAKAMRFAFRMAKSNTNLTEGERALTDNRFFYQGTPRSKAELVKELMETYGMSEKEATRRAEKAKVEHSLVSLIASFTKASLAAEGRWSTKGKDMASEYIGIFDVDGRLELIDRSTGKTNQAALSRISAIRRQMKFYKEYVDGEFTGRTLEDVLIAEAMSEIKEIDSKITDKELSKPWLRDAIREYQENPGKAEALGIQKAVENKEKIEKVNRELDAALPEVLLTSKTLESVGLSKQEKVDLMKDISKAISNSRNKNKKRKGMSTWDFDDTLAKTESDVLWTAPDGTKGRLNATEFAKEGAKLLDQGYKFDFSEFNKVTKGEPGPFLQKALERAKKFGTKDQYVLTARAPEAAPAIKEFLDAQGFNLPLKNIVGLGNSTGAAKARWMLKKFAEGYNDMYFADDAMANVEAVKYVTDRLDIKSKVQQAKALESAGLSVDFNKMVERKTGIEYFKKFSAAKAAMLGRRRWSQSVVVPGAQDFMGLMQNFMGTGKQGNKDFEFFKKNLVDPYSRATKEMNEARQRAADDLRSLKKELPSVNKKLNKLIEGSAFTIDQAVRAYLWTRSGKEVPGLSQNDLRELTDYVESNADVKLFAEGLLKIGRGRWSNPSQHWIGETIISDLFNMNNKERRAEFLEEWIQNKDIIFSEENLNKIEATQGKKFREALEDTLYRMETGSNRPRGANRLTNQFMNWINGSVGATMFLNMRSALAQTISATNYIDFGSNNLFAAAKAFANQKQYWSDFVMIWNSPMLKQRRAGLEYNVQEAELAAALAGQKNKAKAAVAWLLKKGFTPTQIADSFAIAAGGSTFFRNRAKMYMKQGMTEAKALEKAFLDFQEKTESNQQSSRADFISQQQASPLGRTILAWANTPMQYMRLQEKAFRDIVNGRVKGKDLAAAVSRIAYYGAVQSIIFAALQNGLFGFMFDDEGDLDDEDWNRSANRAVDTVIDGQLRGLGVAGSAISALRNAALEFEKQEKKAYDDSYFSQPDHARTLLALTSFSPVLGSKLRKLYSAGQEWNYNRDAISEMGLDIDNPAIDAGAGVIEALTNLPTKRLVQKIDNLRDAADGNNQTWQRIALALGYPGWSLGIENERVQEAKEEGKKNRKSNRSQQSNAAAESENKKDQQRQRNSGQTVTCAAVTRSGSRCKNKVKSGKAYCSYHEKVPQGNTEVQCSHIKKNGKRCKMKTKNKSGKCMYHD